MNLNLNQFLRFPQSRIGRYLVQVTVVAVAYAVGGRLAISIQGVSPFAASVWPPAGIAQAGLLLFGSKVWPAIVLGTFFLNLVNPSEQIFALWLGGNAGAILQAVFAVTALSWFRFRPSLARLKDVVNLILFGGLISTQISCTIGAFSIYLAGRVDWAEYWSLRWNWCLGDTMGVLIFTPLILIFMRPKVTVQRLKIPTEIPNQKKYLMARGVWLILLIGVSWLVFESKHEAYIARYPLEYLPFPLIIWAALELGQRAAVLASFVVSIIAIFGSSHGGGPFIAKAENINQAILFLQAFLAVVTITSLLLAATVAERTSAEYSLRESEIKYRELVENANSIILKLDGDGHITFFNEFAENFFGYKEEQILGKNALGTIIPPTDIEGNNLELVYSQILQNPDRFTSYENENIRRSGDRVWVSWANKPLVDSAGKLLGILCIGTDITDRRKAEIALQKLNEKLEIRVEERTNALKQSELQLQKQKSALIDLAKNKALNQGDLTKALQEITQTASRTLEVARSSVWLYDRTKSKIECLDLFDRTLNQHSHGLELAAADYPAYFQALREERAIAAFDAQKDFRTREFAESYLIPLGITSMLDTPIQIGGETAGVLCLEHVGRLRYWTIEEQSFAVSLADSVTFAMEARERQRAEEALRQAEEKYRSIFENAIVGIFQTTPDGQYLSANPALLRIYGYSSREELVGTLTDISQQLYVDPHRRAEVVRLIEEQGKVSDFESQVYRRDGSIIWISENTYTVRDSYGNLLYYEGTVQDITTRKQAEAALRLEQEKSDRLLLNVLPQPIADRLKQDQSIIADTFAEVTVLFADIVGFTQISSQISPQELVSLLNDIFSTFDRLAEKHGLEKIKTIGDAYMVVGGLPMPRSDHAEAIAQMAIDMQQAITDFSNIQNQDFSIRIGINSGPVVAGVIGIKKFIYDLWGDTVNTASRMESHGKPGCIQVTSAIYDILQDKYVFESRGAIEVKGKGEMNTYFLTGIKL
ncbi:adenylate/guanylate cyclase domain-containing protein [Microcoleus sp. S13_C5]|uniref:adenylate/guanylate cyclase domain-containing protein n=1 Tax=Microcoleus sp. S13_C5 TaxID=3055411 RepID=UPI002FD2970C